MPTDDQLARDAAEYAKMQPADKPSPVRTTLVWLLSAIALSVVAVLVIAGIVANVDTSQPATPSTAPAPRAAAMPLALLSSRGYKSDGGYFIVEGQIRNESDRSIPALMAVATWYDAKGGFITSDTALIEFDPLLPGQTSPFKTMSRGNPEMSRFGLAFKTIAGPQLAHRDLTQNTK